MHDISARAWLKAQLRPLEANIIMVAYLVTTVEL